MTSLKIKISKTTKLNIIYKKYLDTNPQFKIIHNTRVRINKALKHNYKKSSSKELLGCDLDFYKQYLENQFKKDMKICKAPGRIDIGGGALLNLL